MGTRRNTHTAETDTVRPRGTVTGCVILCILLFFMLPVPAGSGNSSDILFRDDFTNLDQWKPLTFPKIAAHTTYTIETTGDTSCLRAESNASASALVHTTVFDARHFNRVRWRWRIEGVYEKGDAREKSGDDYPIRVYVMFRFDPATASFGEKLTYGIARSFYGEYPPHSSLNYLWANRAQTGRIMDSPYTDRSKMIVLQWGNERAGQWLTEEADILKDYREAFGKEPPAEASIAIMNDSDNTGERSVSCVDFIEVYR